MTSCSLSEREIITNKLVSIAKPSIELLQLLSFLEVPPRETEQIVSKPKTTKVSAGYKLDYAKKVEKVFPNDTRFSDVLELIKSDTRIEIDYPMNVRGMNDLIIDDKRKSFLWAYAQRRLATMFSKQMLYFNSKDLLFCEKYSMEGIELAGYIAVLKIYFLDSKYSSFLVSKSLTIEAPLFIHGQGSFGTGFPRNSQKASQP